MSHDTYELSLASPRTNPLIPESIRGLLVEEWTINPHSPLPSFLEMAMMDETQQAAWNSLKSMFSYLQERLNHWSQDSIYHQETSHSFWSRLLSVEKFHRMARFFSETILSSYGPEIRFGIFFFLERRSLLSGSTATISEVIHGGKRVKLCSSPQASLTASPNASREGKLKPITKQDGVQLALLMALGRYLMERGEHCHRLLTENQRFAGGLSLRVRKWLSFLYPFLYSSTKGLNLLQRWRYLLGQSVFFDSYSKWLNLVVRRVVVEDSNAATTSPTARSIADGNPMDIWEYLSILQPFKGIAVRVLAAAVGISWIARLQLMRQQIRRRKNVEGDSKSFWSSPKYLPEINNISNGPPKDCPLCQSPRINPTASSSGYVFCLTCLTTALRGSPVCPITGKECPDSSVVRLFEPHTT